MNRFEHINASSFEHAVSILRQYAGKSCVIAGGSDLLGCLKDNLWLEYPEIVINLKTIAEIDTFTIDNQGLHIGAMTTLTTLATSVEIQKKWPALTKAAHKTASPLLRNIGTIAGNICQENRCWYYRYPDKIGGKIQCVRKGGKICYAIPGDHRYHSIFGAVNKCVAVNPSDTAPALVVLGAIIKTTAREIPIDEFFSAQNGKNSTILEPDELITEIFIPTPPQKSTSSFQKIAYRKSIDFALVNCAVALTFDQEKINAAKICLNGVYNNPYRCFSAEESLQGCTVNDDVALRAGELAVENARPLLQNLFKVQIAKTLVSDTILNLQR